jgi:hypothetical protein
VNLYGGCECFVLFLVFRKRRYFMVRLTFVVPRRPQIAITLAAKPNPSYSIARRIMVPTSLEWQHPVERVFVCRPGFRKILA